MKQDVTARFIQKLVKCAKKYHIKGTLSIRLGRVGSFSRSMSEPTTSRDALCNNMCGSI